MREGGGVKMRRSTRTRLKLLAAVLAVGVVGLLVFRPRKSAVPDAGEPAGAPPSQISAQISGQSEQRKLILDWTGFFGTPMTDRYFDSCPALRDKCHLISDRRLLPDAS